MWLKQNQIAGVLVPWRINIPSILPPLYHSSGRNKKNSKIIRRGQVIPYVYRPIFKYYLVASSDTTTPYEFSTYLLAKARSANDAVKKSTFEDFILGKDRRRYPQFGGLKNELTQMKLGMSFSGWKEIIEKLTSNL